MKKTPNLYISFGGRVAFLTGIDKLNGQMAEALIINKASPCSFVSLFPPSKPANRGYKGKFRSLRERATNAKKRWHEPFGERGQ